MTTNKDPERWKRFGKWLRAQRIERCRELGMARREFVEKYTDVGDGSWATWERGGRRIDGNWVVYRPKNENLYGIARALDLPPADVFKRAGVPMEGDVFPDGGDEKMDMLVEMITALSKKVDELAAVNPALASEMQARVEEASGEVKAARRRTRR